LNTRSDVGPLKNKFLIIFDYDETLVYSDGKHEDFTILKQLQDLGADLCIASKNDKFYMENQLSAHSISDFFRYVMADFRPKVYQIKHILWNYERQGISFDRMFFIDDYEPNIESARSEFPEINCILFGSDIHSIDELLRIVQDQI
jgi:predicted enzyme involved in methoxymalonyl-ACP biosynthesis